MKFVSINTLLLFIAICCFVSCSRGSQLSDKAYHTNHIRREVAKTLTQRYNMKVTHLGANMREQVNLIYICFKVQGPLEQNEARRMILDCVDEMITQVNDYEPIQPYLENRPFGPQNVAITFFVHGENLVDIVHPDFTHIGFNRGELFYKTRDFRIQKPYIIEVRETYDEAKDHLS